MPPGIQLRAGKIRINFYWHGQRHHITLPYPVTPTTIQQAANTRTQIIQKIKWGLLTEHELAILTGHPQPPKAASHTFGDYAQQYLDDLKGTAYTREKYLSLLNRFWMPALGHLPITQITAAQLRQITNRTAWTSPKVRNDALIPLRGTFALAWHDEIITKNPCERLRNIPLQDSEPDPFTRAEMEALLAHMAHTYAQRHPELHWYSVLAFWTGCRPSELIALCWRDVDLTARTLSITKGRVHGTTQHQTKNRQPRLVYLNDRAYQAIEAMHRLTGRRQDHVFICSTTDAPWQSTEYPSLAITRAIKHLRIRPRPAYNTRHTYATLLMMDGVNLAFIASQLGHSLLMLTKRYARWIHGDQSRSELAKLNTHPPAP